MRRIARCVHLFQFYLFIHLCVFAHCVPSVESARECVAMRVAASAVGRTATAGAERRERAGALDLTARVYFIVKRKVYYIASRGGGRAGTADAPTTEHRQFQPFHIYLFTKFNIFDYITLIWKL